MAPEGAGGGAGGPDPAHPLKNHKAILFFSNTGSDPLRRRANEWPAFCGIWNPLFPHQLKKLPELDHILKNFLDPRMRGCY